MRQTKPAHQAAAANATRRLHGHTQNACEAFKNTQTEPGRPNTNSCRNLMRQALQQQQQQQQQQHTHTTAAQR
jgi:hypothetical protein